MKGMRFVFYATLIIVTGVVLAAASFIGKAQNEGDTARQPGTALTENDFVKDPTLFAVPDAGVAVTFLENPDSISEPDDTGTVGMDIIPFKYSSGMNQTFCWEDDNKESSHFMTLVDGSGTELLRVEANGDCVTQFINQGEYEMRIQHDDSTEEVFATVFSIPEENADNSSETTLSTNKCQGCDLSGADFSNAILTKVDLHGADLSGANLSNADLSGANLSDTLLADADLRGANLTNANLSGADLTNADLRGAKFGSAVGTAVTRPAEQPELAQEEPGAAEPCPGGNLRPIPVMEDMKDLVLSKACNVPAGVVYQYGEINIVNGGSLTFKEEKGKQTHFWAKSILIENGGALNAGFDPATGKITPFGTNGGQLTIHLYGDEMDKAGITCKSPNQTSEGSCVPSDAGVKINKMDVINPPSCEASSKLPGGVQNECFYEYKPPDDMAGETGVFGRKVLAVSFGGALRLFGLKGATYKDKVDNWDSGTSWVRLRNDRDAKPDKTIINLDRDVDWEEGDRIVITTTDYLPGHSEELQIVKKMTKRKLRVTIINPETNKPFDGCEMEPQNNPKTCGLQYLHNGDTYPDQGFNFQSNFLKSQDLKIELRNGGMDNDKPLAETRAAVALLTRSIRIVSGGPMIPTDEKGQKCTNECFPVSDRYFGGHLMIRQGFEEAKIQGVEFFRLGQGGLKARYPVHFHLVRTAPDGTFAKDNSVNESMTRWYTLHGTQGVLLARNVGYKSIGHGYYIEDGTETDNKLYSNIGIFARAAIDNKQNPRKVPGILAYTADKLNVADAPFHSDYAQPTVFWIMNGWNDFEYNMAAGANACGACYWWVPGEISGPSRKMKWFSYASEQSAGRGGITPLKNFMGNYCSSAMNAFNSIRDTSPCNGVGGPPPTNPVLEPVTAGNLSPKPPNQGGTDLEYYPILAGDHKPTRCPGGDKTDCSKTPVTCAAGAARKDCTVPVIDRFTTAFTWPETNFAAIWLRPQWYLVINSVISDVQNAGLTFVTGGDYTESNFVPGQWQLARQNVFIGQTQPDPPGGEPNYASDTGPVNASTKLVCEDKTDKAKETLYCLLRDEGITFPLSSFANNQRLFSIYDGPSFEDSNAFFNIKKAFIDDCKFNPMGSGNCETSQSMYGRVLGMPYDEKDKKCFLPNAAIGWKQPNGFYYPPAFHSSNLYFHKDVDIRHFVIEPLFEPGIKAFKSWDKAVKENYCTWAVNNAMGFGGSFNNFSAIDRQTILNDDDGSLTGLKNTISVNQDPFFKAPTETIECRSGEVGTDEELKKGTAKTSPYDYVTTVVYPGCVEKGDCGGHCAKDMKPCAIADNCAKMPPGNDRCVIDENWFWHSNCGSNFCYGVPLYRQLLTKDEASNKKGEEIRMMGMDFFQRSNLTANNGVYYIDTTVSKAKQEEGLLRRGDPLKFNVFKGSAAGDKYYVLLIFAKETTKQTYQIYVGKDRKEKIEDIVNAIRSPLKSSKPLDVMPTDWPAKWVRRWYKDDPTKGIVEVTLDFSGIKQSDFDDARMDRCKPESFCTWTGSAASGKCQCSDDLKARDSVLYDQCMTPLPVISNDKEKRKQNTICDWAVRALDCPKGGCYGFSFTLTEDPPAEPLDPPAPCCYPGPPQFTDSPWNVKFVTVGEKIAGACSNTPHPDPEFCSNEPPCPTPTPAP